jgi:hypothetical protein
MEQDGMNRYRILMETVKLRIALIDDIMHGKCSLPDIPLIESAASQFRKVLELVAFGSLVANEKVYRTMHADFAKEWNAKKLLAKLGKLNLDFYPIPVKQVQPEKPGMLLRHEKVTQGYLSKKTFIDAYQQCSELIHTTNPYSKKSHFDPKVYSKTFFEWRNEIVSLLNLHELRLYNDPGMAACSMNAGGTNQVQVYRFAPPSSSTGVKP